MGAFGTRLDGLVNIFQIALQLAIGMANSIATKNPEIVRLSVAFLDELRH